MRDEDELGSLFEHSTTRYSWNIPGCKATEAEGPPVRRSIREMKDKP